MADCCGSGTIAFSNYNRMDNWEVLSEKITILIPTLNEAEGIGPTIEEIKAELRDPLVIVSDACSSDGTDQIAKGLGAEVLIEKQRGKGRQMAAALRRVPQDTKWLVMMDGDCTMPAVYIPLMIAYLKRRRKVAMVSGNRMFYRRHAFWTDFRSGTTSFGSRFSRFNFLTHSFLSFLHLLLNSVDMEDPTSGMRVVRYESVRDFVPRAQGFDIEVEMNSFIQSRSGLDVIEFPIHRLYWVRKRLGVRKISVLSYLELVRRMVIVAL